MQEITESNNRTHEVDAFKPKSYEITSQLFYLILNHFKNDRYYLYMDANKAKPFIKDEVKHFLNSNKAKLLRKDSKVKIAHLFIRKEELEEYIRNTIDKNIKLNSGLAVNILFADIYNKKQRYVPGYNRTEYGINIPRNIKDLVNIRKTVDKNNTITIHIFDAPRHKSKSDINKFLSSYLRKIVGVDRFLLHELQHFVQINALVYSKTSFILDSLRSYHNSKYEHESRILETLLQLIEDKGIDTVNNSIRDEDEFVKLMINQWIESHEKYNYRAKRKTIEKKIRYLHKYLKKNDSILNLLYKSVYNTTKDNYTQDEIDRILSNYIKKWTDFVKNTFYKDRKVISYYTATSSTYSSDRDDRAEETVREREERMRSNYRWLPVAFRMSYYGGWLSPRGIIYSNQRANYDSHTLKRGHLNLPADKRDRWNLEDYALRQGWIRFGYWQSYGGSNIDLNNQTKRRLILSVHPDSGILDDTRQFKRVLSVLQFYEDFFGRSNIEFEVKVVQFLNLDVGDEPIQSYIDSEERFYTKQHTDLYLQILKRDVEEE